MAKKLWINMLLCDGCRACEEVCREINKLPNNVFRIKVEKITRNKGGDYKKSADRFKIKICMQCVKPQCVSACTQGALKKRNDGVIDVDLKLCNGCKRCIDACPIDAIFFNPFTGKIEKCNLCVDKNVKLPFCVESCQKKALSFNDPCYLVGIPW